MITLFSNGFQLSSLLPKLRKFPILGKVLTRRYLVINVHLVTHNEIKKGGKLVWKPGNAQNAMKPSQLRKQLAQPVKSSSRTS